MNIAYIRVSTLEQNEETQKRGLEKYNIEKWFVEKVSGKTANRPKLMEMLDFVREGDTVYIHDFSRIARSTKDLLDIFDKLNAKGVKLISNKENLDTSTPAGKLMLTMIGAIYEFERANMLERQKEGIEIAKSKGHYKGRQEVPVDPHKWRELMKLKAEGKITITGIAEELGVSRQTVYKRMTKEKAAKK